MTYTPINSIRVNGTLFTMSERTFNDVCEGAQLWWDSESRKSPFSTVTDPDDDSYCEACDQEVVYDGTKHGTCGCES